MIRLSHSAMIAILLMTTVARAIDYPYSTAEPQKTGWPLTAEERAYIVDKAEHDRRPGREANKHLPHLWPVVPSAGYFGGDAWLKLHEEHVKTVQANAGPVDVLLVGDSITIQWGESWKKHFPDRKAVNIGIGGDKTQNVLWRLDHGGVEGLGLPEWRGLKRLLERSANPSRRKALAAVCAADRAGHTAHRSSRQALLDG